MLDHPRAGAHAPISTVRPQRHSAPVVRLPPGRGISRIDSCQPKDSYDETTRAPATTVPSWVSQPAFQRGMLLSIDNAATRDDHDRVFQMIMAAWGSQAVRTLATAVGGRAPARCSLDRGADRCARVQRSRADLSTAPRRRGARVSRIPRRNRTVHRNLTSRRSSRGFSAVPEVLRSGSDRACVLAHQHVDARGGGAR